MTMQPGSCPVVVITVNFNNSLETGRLIRSLESQKGIGANCHLGSIVVNNSSSLADSRQLHEICAPYSWVRILDCPENPGYFGGLNRGLDMLAHDTKQTVVVCNNDLDFASDFLSILSSRRYADAVKVVCPDVVTPGGVHQNPHIQRRISKFRRLQFDAYFSHYFVAFVLQALVNLLPSRKRTSPVLTEQEIHMGVGACYVLTPSFFRDFRSLEYTEYLYGEEAFLSHQVHSVNGKVWFDPALRVLHTQAASLSKLPSRKRYEFARSGYPKYRHML